MQFICICNIVIHKKFIDNCNSVVFKYIYVKHNWVMQQLKNAGYKVTKPRQKITNFISHHDGIFSIQDIQNAHPGLDKVSLYRTIETLTALDLIDPIAHMNGMQHYELHSTNHHHHALCTKCKKIAHVTCAIPKKIIRGFSQIHHTLLLTGLCRTCSQ